MKICSISLAIMEVQVTIKKKSTYSLEWLNLKWPIISANKDVEQPAQLHPSGKNFNDYSSFRKVLISLNT